MADLPQSPQRREAELLRGFVTLADTLVGDYDVIELLHELSSYCIRLLDRVAAAGILLRTPDGKLETVADSDERSRTLDLFELQHNQGPCPECCYTGQPVLVADIAAQRGRWAGFVAQALHQGFRGVYALPLRLRQETIGALNLFATLPDPLPETDLRLAQALADTATIGILSQRARRHQEMLSEQLQAALTSRVGIEQAKGMIAQAGGINTSQAFEMLRHYGRARSTRLSDIAHQITSGALDPTQVLPHHRAFGPAPTEPA